MGPKMNYASEFENLNKLITDIKTDLEGKATTAQLDALLKEIRAKDEKIEITSSTAVGHLFESTIYLCQKMVGKLLMKYLRR